MHQMDFIRRQFEISQQLVRSMTTDIEYRRQISDIAEHYKSELAQKNRQIAKLESTIQAMKCLYGDPAL